MSSDEILTVVPGYNGNDCPYNGEHFDNNGNLIECQCDECDFMMCCVDIAQVFYKV